MGKDRLHELPVGPEKSRRVPTRTGYNPGVITVTDHTLEELQARFEALGEKPFRARQVLSGLYRGGAKSYDEMTDLPKALRARLVAEIPLRCATVTKVAEARDGTAKLLVAVRNGDLIESVVIPERERLTVCISTQVGCPVACLFCASGLDGLKRQLSPGEIVEQVLLARERGRVTHVVLMGIGEPLLNYKNTLKALTILHASWGLGIGFNKITLSTAGVADKIVTLAGDGATPNLAISLHAPNDELRRKLVPKIRRWSVDRLVEVGKAYRSETGKDVTFEYVLLAGVNDSQAQAVELARRVRGSKCKINVIPYNPVPGLPYARPAREAVSRFIGALRAGGAIATTRATRGDDASAACGQLRAAGAGLPTPHPQLPTAIGGGSAEGGETTA